MPTKDLIGDEVIDDVGELVYLCVAPKVFCEIIKTGKAASKEGIEEKTALGVRYFDSMMNMMAIRSSKDTKEFKAREKRNWQAFFKKHGLLGVGKQ